MKLSHSLLLPALLACVPPALAASNTQLAVQGTITPSACQPSLGGGGNVDHGKVSAKDLNSDAHTSLQQASMAFVLDCEGPTLIALKTIDNRAGTSIFPDWYAHGLGTTAQGENLGSVRIALNDPVADSVAVASIASTDDGVTWVPASPLGHGALTAFALKGDTANQPIALQHLNANMTVYTTLEKASSLTLTDEVPIDGHATLEVKYL